MDIIKKIAEELQIRPDQVQAVVNLIDEGNTIPFIARYRKEAHGALNDEILRNLDERLTYLRNLEEKKSSVLASMEELGVLTDDLKKKMEQAQTLAVIEDLYRPYRPKRRTRATIAKEKGLEPLANEILLGQAKGTKEELAKAFVSPEKGVESTEDALLGAIDILAEHISDDASFRAQIRKMTWEKGMLTSTVREEGTESVFETYYEFQAQLTKINGHQVLAVNRGENQKVLSVKIEAPQEEILIWLYNVMTKGKNETCAAILREATEDAYKRLIAPAIERELRTNLTETAEEGAMKVFGQNLKQLLMQPPIAGQTVLGWDPAFRTGCKLAVIDPFGKVIDTKVIYPTAPHNKVKESKDILKALIAKYHITLISVGNGTASRESEQIIADLIKEINAPVRYVITNEAGASVYSASKQATEEFPNFDVGQRSAVSIARRVQDPLAELVKIDPKAIGVGQYQHDMNQKKLDEMLHGTVEDCVNQVGVDLNTASAALLEYVSGITKTIAKNIVTYREENGQFTNRKQLLKVAKLGPKAYEQCAGFLRIHDGDNPLDDTSVHPESYEAAMKLLDKMGLTMEDVRTAQKQAARQLSTAAKPAPKQNNRNDRRKQIVIHNTNTAMGKALAAAMGGSVMNLEENDSSAKKPVQKESVANTVNAISSLEKKIRDKSRLAVELGIGEITLTDILKELEKPSRDPRESMPAPILRSDVLDMKDLKPGMILKGTVRNVIDFGVFVDIGVHQDGLVHISQITDRYIRHPLEAVSVGDIVDVQVLSVDVPKKRIALTMKINRDQNK